jgi:alpha-beta hydrolase superfamily lysophospholipase
VNRRAALSGLLATLAACAATDSGGDDPPAGDGSAAAGGRLLPRTVWAPEGRPRAVILALHGFNDHRRAFALFGPWAAAHGILLEAYDQRGFGENPDRGLWPGSRVLVADAIARLRELRESHPGVPLHLLGTSMGAAVAALAAARAPAAADSVILSAPAVWGGAAMNPFYRAVLWVAARLFPDLRLTGESLKRQATDNLEVLRELARDPLFIRRTRLAAIEGVVGLMGEAWDAAGALRLPTLVLVGRRDEIVPVDVQLAFARRVASDACTLAVYPEGWHMLLRDLQRERVYADIAAWIAGSPLPSGLARPCHGTGLAAAVPGRDIAGAPRAAARVP